MSSVIDNLPSSETDNNIDPDVNNILSNLQNDYDENIDDNNYMDNYNTNLDNNLIQNENLVNLNQETETKSESIVESLINKCKQPLIVLIVVLLINNNFTFSIFKSIPQLATDGVLNMLGYTLISLIIAVAFFMLNMVSSQFL